MPGRGPSFTSSSVHLRRTAPVPAILATTRSGLTTRVRMQWWSHGAIALIVAIVVLIGTAGVAQALDLVVDTTIDTSAAAFQACDPNPALIDCSLRGAILRANAVAGPHTITVKAGFYELTVAGRNDDTGLTGDLDILRSITINGAPGPDATIITGSAAEPLANRDRIFHVLPAGSLTLSRREHPIGGERD
jgi:hypothetical protein